VLSIRGQNGNKATRAPSLLPRLTIWLRVGDDKRYGVLGHGAAEGLPGRVSLLPRPEGVVWVEGEQTRVGAPVNLARQLLHLG
jgi:hypothetical protein